MFFALLAVLGWHLGRADTAPVPELEEPRGGMSADEPSKGSERGSSETTGESDGDAPVDGEMDLEEEGFADAWRDPSSPATGFGPRALGPPDGRRSGIGFGLERPPRA